ncbi:glycoside hydrolase family 26 protein [Microlunatus sp. Gsoil 973]|uniref:glycoside hydrolase family 26 protein n=1 Tax=Microlunatus sp. Gsoil 973 TaxID=2672569 RepID=UPI0018A7FA73|nr:glycosyl hydrolase [Microlunatus sp. Gsoil 973]
MIALLSAAVVVSTIAACGLRPRVPSIAPPARGALFGAYVDPPRYTEKERIAAFEQFEGRLGRRLDIYHDYHTWTDPFPSDSDRHFTARGTTLMISWAGTDTRDIVAGRYDTLIRRRAEAVAALGRPVLLRWRWEMNRPNLASQIGSGTEYVAAWRHIHRIFGEADVSNVGWVWCPLTGGAADQNFGAYYPGDAYVDWVCVDGYPRSPRESFGQVFRPFVKWASGVPKPIMIGEFGRTEGPPGSRAEWLDAARDYVESTPQIKAVCYFQSARGVSGNYSVIKESDALRALRGWVTDPYFSP